MVIQTIIALMILLADPSEQKSAVFLQYSFPKLLLIVLTASIFIILLITYLISTSKQEFFNKIITLLKRNCESGFGGYLVLISMCGSTYGLLAVGFALSNQWISPSQHSVLYHTLTNSLPLIILWALLSIELFIQFSFVWQWKLHLPDLSKLLLNVLKSKAFGIFWLISIITASLLHWHILIFRWEVLDKIQFWYWQTTTKDDLNLWLVIPISVLFFAGYWILHSNKLSKGAKILILVIIGYLLMIGFAAIEGDPYQVLYEKRYISGHRNYIAVAARNEGGVEFLFDYEAALSHDRFFATKPPGVYLLYRGILGLGSLVFPVDGYEEKYDAINHTIMLLFPILSLCTAIVAEKLTSRFTRIKPSLLPSYLLIITPNFLLLICTIDQAIVPLLFSFGILFGAYAITHQSWTKSVLFGCYIYLCLYFSFSLLPMILMFGLWILLEIIRDWKNLHLTKYLKFAVGITIGFVLFYILFLIIFNYSPIQRYQNAITIHEVQRLQPGSIKQYLNMYLLNNIEFATWIGLPLAVTILFSMITSLMNFVWGHWKSIDSLAIAFTGTYFFVNQFGNTLSEVGRLWIFFVPFMCIFAVDFIHNRLRKSKYLLVMLLLQLVTVVLIVQHLRITWE